MNIYASEARVEAPSDPAATGLWGQYKRLHIHLPSVEKLSIPTFHSSSGGGAREMTQQLGVLAALPEDPGSVLGTHMVAHSSLWLQFQGRQHPHTDIYEGKTSMNIK